MECFFCCQTSKDLLDEENEILKKFFKFLNRHLNNSKTRKEDFVEENGICAVACEKCFKIAKDFCNIYHDFKTIELLLNWQLGRVNEVLKSGRDSSSRENVSRTVTEDARDVVRNKLIKKCSKALTSAYPQIVLIKLPGLEDKERSEASPSVNNNFKIEGEHSKIHDEPLPSTTNVTSHLYPQDTETEENAKTFVKFNTCDKTNSILGMLSTHGKSECSRTTDLLEREVGEVMEIGDDYEINNPSDQDSHSLASRDWDEIAPEKTRKNDPKKENKESGSEDKKEYFIKNKEGRWHCCFCTNTYPSIGRLRPHLLAKHPTKWHLIKFPIKSKVRSCNRFKCPDCDELFEKAHLLILHWKKHQNAESNRIPVELVSFTVDPKTKLFQGLHAELKKPRNFAKIEIAFPNDLFICNCGRSFYSNKDLKAHEKVHGSFPCGINCSEIKQFLPELAMHEVKCKNREKSNQNDHQCPRCEFKFKDYTSFFRHYCFVHFSLDFVEHSCPVCKTYLIDVEQRNQKHDLFEHLQRLHNLDDLKEMFRCDEEDCSAYFFDLLRLDYHKEVDHGLGKAEIKEMKGARKNVCDICGKGFKYLDTLKRHLLFHSGPESWQFCCEVCAKKCINESKLREHMRTHTNAKPFVCEVCGAKYAHGHNLRIHVSGKHGGRQDIPKKHASSCPKKGVKRKASSIEGQFTKKKNQTGKNEEK